MSEEGQAAPLCGRGDGEEGRAMIGLRKIRDYLGKIKFRKITHKYLLLNYLKYRHKNHLKIFV